MDPQQELFTELLLRLKDLEYDVYDTFLPPEGTPYPFIYLADSQQTDIQTKSAVVGNVYQTFHVWHNNPKLLQIGTYGEFCMDDTEYEPANSSGQHNQDSTSAWSAGSGV